jgi:hypothetical protein
VKIVYQRFLQNYKGAVLQAFLESDSQHGLRHEHYGIVMSMLAQNPEQTLPYLGLIANMILKMLSEITEADMTEVVALTVLLLDAHMNAVLAF